MTTDRPASEEIILTALGGIREKLGDLVTDNWESDTENWGDAVALYRDYVDGRHRLELTKEMADLLRISKEDTERFAINYADLVVTTKCDRLLVERIEAFSVEGTKEANEKAQEWTDQVFLHSRFDGLQIDTHESVVGDGDGFITVDVSRLGEGGFPLLVYEPAYDRQWGMIPVYDRTYQRLLAPVKIWEEAGIDGVRVNLYYPDRIEKYVASDSGLVPFDVDGAGWPTPWLDRNGEPFGVPFVHFKNEGKRSRAMGRSAIAKMMPAQDVLNRTFMSMTITAELTAFGLYVLIGATLGDKKVAPGTLYEIAAKGLGKEEHMPQFFKMEPSEIKQFVEQAQFAIEQILTITNTPLPGQMGSDTQSGEALKQRESGLLAWARKAQIKFGNAWEDAMMLAWRAQEAFGTVRPPAIARFNTVWKDPQVRNQTEVVKNTVLIADRISEQEFLRRVGYDEAKIKQIQAEKEEEAVAALANLAKSAPQFGQLGLPGFGAIDETA